MYLNSQKNNLFFTIMFVLLSLKEQNYIILRRLKFNIRLPLNCPVVKILIWSSQTQNANTEHN